MTPSELTQFVKEFSDEITQGDVTCNCFKVCAPLCGLLELYGEQCQLVCGDFTLPNGDLLEHYWIDCGDYIIDPTCSQLNDIYDHAELDCPYVGEKPDWYPDVRMGE